MPEERQKSKKRVEVSIKLPSDWFKLKKISTSDFQQRISFLIETFGSRYLDVFTDEIHDTNEAEYVFSVSQIFQEIGDLPGFSRFVKAFNRKDALALMFSSKIAILLKEKFGIELEPVPPSGGRTPDLKVSCKSNPVFIECKTVDTKKFYNLDQTRKIARRIRAELQTPNQIDVYYDDPKNLEGLYSKLTDKKFVNRIVDTKKQLELFVEKGIRIVVVPREKYSDKSFTSTLTGIMEDNDSGKRRPGFVFTEAGQPTGIFGPLVDFSSCLEGKRKQSQTQRVVGFPYILAIDVSNILGDPNENLKRIKRWFQPGINKRYSGVLLCKTYFRDATSYSIEVEFLKNSHSSHEIGNSLETFFQKKHSKN